MDITYNYTKIRKRFGRQPLFCEVPPHLLDSIYPDKVEQKRYILRNPVDRFTMAGPVQSEHIINTKRVKSKESGTNHAEGGWPKDVNYCDEEATNRHRRRIERDDAYVSAVLSTARKIEHYVDQNNALELYQMYFKSMPSQTPVEKINVTVKNIFFDKSNYKRPVACIDWTAEDETKIVIAHCNKSFPIIRPVNRVYSCYIWGLEDPSDPYFIFEPPTDCWKVSCSPYNPKIILGGLQDGRVCIFDISKGDKPVSITPAHLAFRTPVNSLIYMHSRMNTEFFCASTDGLCTWWDIRNLQEPYEKMLICFQLPPLVMPSFGNAHPVSCLQYEKIFPTRFLCGTDTGFIINVNRRGKTLQDQMSSVFEAHIGAVKAIQRSPLSAKLFISCGDFTVNIWSDDINISPIITGTQQRHPVNDACWSPTRMSIYMTVTGNGKFKIYDLLRKYREPVITLPVSQTALLTLNCHESGQLVAIGNRIGATYLLALSESLIYSAHNDKSIMLQNMDREHHREHILENRIKEIRLKLKQEEEKLVEVGPTEPELNEEEICKLADDEYKKIVSQELKLMSDTENRNKSGLAGRKR